MRIRAPESLRVRCVVPFSGTADDEAEEDAKEEKDS